MMPSPGLVPFRMMPSVLALERVVVLAAMPSRVTAPLPLLALSVLCSRLPKGCPGRRRA